ncbi:ATP-binding protein [Cupriavidus sp. 2SB]|uniref:ATP-binding protein n=1 Tax=Cupriavidus sp. 2SB TaxID=2502199 RepID=UPI0014859816|nr:ATP-binding protein [Cupriavidus sp. 2SB]
MLVIIGTSLSLMWTAVAVWMYRDFNREVRSVLDARLQASARMVSNLMDRLPTAQPNTRFSPAFPIAKDASGGLVCEISLSRDTTAPTLLARTTGSPGLMHAQPGYGTYEIGGMAWRVYVLQRDGVRISTAEPENVRRGLLRDYAMSGGVPFLAAVMGSLAILWLAIARGLAPLERIRLLLSQRIPGDTSPLPAISAPSELRPLISTLRHLLIRVQEALLRERQFSDDAAHELRTPLTAIRTNIQVAILGLRNHAPLPLVERSMANAEAGALRLQATLESLLLLARVEAGDDDPAKHSTDFVDTLRQSVQELGSSMGAMERIVVTPPADASPIWVSVPPALLASAIRNLLENALRHAPFDTVVDARIERTDNRVVRLFVVDRGPGLSPDQITHATERFWRCSPSAEGSGLGLAIVKAIASEYEGTLTLSSPSTGLTVCLEFPFAADD